MGKAGTTLPRARGICLVLTHLRRYSAFPQTGVFGWLRGVDLNHRPLGYEPNELPDCSTPLFDHSNVARQRQFGLMTRIGKPDSIARLYLVTAASSPSRRGASFLVFALGHWPTR